MKIWIDAGHGGIDPGAVWGTRLEKHDNLSYALLLSQKFRALGFEILLTRSDDRTLTLVERTNLENAGQCALAIACHRNAAAVPSARGLELWLHSRAPASYVDWAKDMAAGIAQAGLPLRRSQIPQKAADGVFRGFRSSPSANYYANSGTRAPSVLIELGFLTSEEDNTLFDAGEEALCDAIVAASCRFLGVTPPKTDLPS